MQRLAARTAARTARRANAAERLFLGVAPRVLSRCSSSASASRAENTLYRDAPSPLLEFR